MEPIEINEITGYWTFLSNVSVFPWFLVALNTLLRWFQIDWQDPWLIGLLFFHVVTTATALLTRNRINFQVILFLTLCKCIQCWCLKTRIRVFTAFSVHGLLLRANQRICRHELEDLLQATILWLQWTVHIHRVLDANSIELYVTYRSLVVQLHSNDGAAEECPNETEISTGSSRRQENTVITKPHHHFRRS